MKNDMNLRFGTLAVIVLVVAFSRLVPHIPNVAPVAAMALFGGAYFSSRRAAFLVPLLAMFLSDVAMHFTQGYEIFSLMRLTLYGTFAAITLIGLQLRGRVGVASVFSASLGASVLFFAITNLAVWILGGGTTYPLNGAGIVACYTAAIPFFRNTLLGDMVFAALLFGGFELAKSRLPFLAGVKTKSGR